MHGTRYNRLNNIYYHQYKYCYYVIIRISSIQVLLLCYYMHILIFAIKTSLKQHDCVCDNKPSLHFSITKSIYIFTLIYISLQLIL